MPRHGLHGASSEAAHLPKQAKRVFALEMPVHTWNRWAHRENRRRLCPSSFTGRSMSEVSDQRVRCTLGIIVTIIAPLRGPAFQRPASRGNDLQAATNNEKRSSSYNTGKVAGEYKNLAGKTPAPCELGGAGQAGVHAASGDASGCTYCGIGH